MLRGENKEEGYIPKGYITKKPLVYASVFW